MAFTIENQFPPTQLFGREMFAVTGNAVIMDNTNPAPGYTENSATILQKGSPAIVRFSWDQKGWLCYLLSATWNCNVYLEKFGPGESLAIPAGTKAVTPQTGETNFSTDVDLSNLDTGVYKVVATLSLNGPQSMLPGTPGIIATPVHSYEELGILQVV